MKQSLEIIYEDAHIIVVNKPEGMLSVSTSRGREEVTAHSILCDYMQNSIQQGKENSHGRGSSYERGNNSYRNRREERGNRGGRIFIVHRLDRETSGLMVFAKSEEIKRLLQENWERAVTLRGYVAVLNCSAGMTPGPRVQWEADPEGSTGTIRRAGRPLLNFH